MKKEVSLILIIILLAPFSYAQLNSIEIKDVNVNESQLQVLVQNNFNQDFNKITFIINNQYEIIQEEVFSNFTAKYFIINYQAGIKLESLQVIIDGNTAIYRFIGNEDTFVINQATSQTSELTQVQESNSPVSYIYSGQRLAKIQDNNVIYFTSDNIGSTSLETDNLGNIKTKSNYLPFGKELSFNSINDEKYGFTSKEYDYESSLNYFNARYYNPNNGKFISNDPIFKPSEGGYQYVRNNPLTITDPSGKDDQNVKLDDSTYGTQKVYSLVIPITTKQESLFFLSDMSELFENGENNFLHIYLLGNSQSKNSDNGISFNDYSLLYKDIQLDKTKEILYANMKRFGIQGDLFISLLPLDIKNTGMDFIDRLSKTSEEVFTMGHGSTRSYGFLTLGAQNDLIPSHFYVSWERYLENSRWTDFSCGSTCPLDPYSKPLTQADTLQDIKKNKDSDRLIRYVWDDPLIMRNRHDIKTLQRIYYERY